VLEGREKIACVQRSWILRGLGVEAEQQAQQFSCAGCCLLILVGWMLDSCVGVVVLCCSLLQFFVLEGREKIACVQRSWILRGLGVEAEQQAQQFSCAGCCFC